MQVDLMLTQTKIILHLFCVDKIGHTIPKKLIHGPCLDGID
jgi:hypothetical protein